MRIETIRYQRTNSKNPSGFNIWAFDYETTEGLVTLTTPTSMLYTDAKVWAIRQGRSMDLTSDQIFVSP